MKSFVLLLLLAAPVLAGPASNATLAHRVRAQPRGPEAKEAMAELYRRGEEGRRFLATLVRDVARKDADAALAIVRVLADDPEQLQRAWRDNLPAVVRVELALAMAPRYPAESARLEKALFDPALPRRRELLQALADANVPGAVLRRALDDRTLADLAFSILLDRGWTPPASELKVVARTVVEQNPDVGRLCRELKQGRMWSLLEAVADFTPESLAAHVLMLRVSGRDIARDPLLWNSWIAAKRESYEIPDAAAPGRIAAAILLGAEFLRQDLLADGKSEQDGRHIPGATALSIFALRAADVPADDPAIQKALATSIFDEQGAFDREVLHHNYTCTITIMALAALDPQKYGSKIQRLASLVVSSQLPNGQWTYSLRDRYAQRNATWPPRPFGDNSNTQYALLGLRAARRAGADVPAETWMRAMTFWLSIVTDRGWTYGAHHSHAPSTSMTAAGLSSVAICLEGLFGKAAAARIAKNAALERGLQALGRTLLSRGYANVDLYAYYGIERACILNGVRRFNDFDWYRTGAIGLLARQRPDGAFSPARGGKGWRYGAAVDTAYALLFLKRATTPIDGMQDSGTVEVDTTPRVRPRGRGRGRGRMQRQ